MEYNCEKCPTRESCPLPLHGVQSLCKNRKINYAVLLVSPHNTYTLSSRQVTRVKKGSTSRYCLDFIIISSPHDSRRRTFSVFLQPALFVSFSTIFLQVIFCLPLALQPSGVHPTTVKLSYTIPFHLISLNPSISNPYSSISLATCFVRIVSAIVFTFQQSMQVLCLGLYYGARLS